MSLDYIVAPYGFYCGFQFLNITDVIVGLNYFLMLSVVATANLSRGKTFTVFAVLKPSAKVFQPYVLYQW